MADFTKGWVKLWRSSIKRGWLKNHKLWVFWTYCLMKASGIDTQEINNYNQIKLKRGQFIFGLKRASEDLNMGIRSIRTCLTQLEKWRNIDRQSNNQFSVITVLNYSSYNPLKSETDKQTDKQATNDRQASDKRTTTLKKDKKDKKDKNNTIIEFFNYFLLKTNKKFKLTPERQRIIKSRLKDHTLEDLKKAVDNFVQDDWPERHKHMDIVYCIGIRNKIDKLETWLNWKPTPQRRIIA